MRRLCTTEVTMATPRTRRSGVRGSTRQQWWHHDLHDLELPKNNNQPRRENKEKPEVKDDSMCSVPSYQATPVPHGNNGGAASQTRSPGLTNDPLLLTTMSVQPHAAPSHPCNSSAIPRTPNPVPSGDVPPESPASTTVPFLKRLGPFSPTTHRGPRKQQRRGTQSAATINFSYLFCHLK